MVVRYHCFNDPQVARGRFKDEVGGLTKVLPDETLTIAVSLQYRQPVKFGNRSVVALDHDFACPRLQEIDTLSRQ